MCKEQTKYGVASEDLCEEAIDKDTQPKGKEEPKLKKEAEYSFEFEKEE